MPESFHMCSHAGMASSFTTLADLVREGASALFRCGGCGRYGELSPYALNGGVWSADAHPEMEGREIAPIIARLKCRSCGARVGEWWPKVSRRA